MPKPSPLLLVLDGNSLIHRTYHAGSLEDQDSWALRGFIRYAARAVSRLRPDAIVVGFDCPVSSVRRTDFPAYKAHRPDKPGELVAQLAAAPGLLRDAGLCTVVPAGYEADDVLASSAAHARAAGWRSVLMTSDRDAFALIDDVTSVLRLRNGGFDEAVLIDPPGLHELCGVHPGQYLDYAALRGDPSDNLPGVRGFGAAVSAKLLAALGTVEAAWADLDSGGGAVRAAVGEQAALRLAAPESREVVARNRTLMRMRADLPVPHLDGARLPLSSAAVRAALAAAGTGPTLGPALWALAAPRTPAPRSAIEPHPPVFRRPQRHRREPTPGQLSLF